MVQILPGGIALRVIVELEIQVQKKSIAKEEQVRTVTFLHVND